MVNKCPKCGFENPEITFYCGKCATPLASSQESGPSQTETIQTPVKEMGTGTTFAGRYQIIEELGKGGTGVVYKAEDTKLSRNVAIRVLPEFFTSDPERLAHFEQEARALTSLSHPNIAALYGVEEVYGKCFLVLELVRGETLADRLRRLGALPLEKTLVICRQIAEGLKGAHDKGIYHLDLKPSNVTVTPEIKVKILDFGVAKAVYYSEVTEVDLSKPPTVSAYVRDPDVMVGAVPYWSPEQVSGEPVDKRADIWAFGCILFECLTGESAFFSGPSLAYMLGKDDLNWDSLPAGTPENVRAVLRRCLQKDPRVRLGDIGDAWLEIKSWVPPACFRK
jgi:serine/threonine-protein kinase